MKTIGHQWERSCHSPEKVVLSLPCGSCWVSALYPLTAASAFPELGLFLQGQTWKLLSRKAGQVVNMGVKSMEGGGNFLTDLHCDRFW